MKNSSSNKFIGSLTLFLILGSLSILGGIIFAVFAFNSVSAADGLAGLYVLFGLIPVTIVIIIDRLFVWKFGAKRVNTIQLYIAGTLVGLFLLNWIRLQLQ